MWIFIFLLFQQGYLMLISKLNKRLIFYVFFHIFIWPFYHSNVPCWILNCKTYKETTVLASPTDPKAYYYTTGTLNALHETERFENGTKRFGNGMLWERNETFLGRNETFLGRNEKCWEWNDKFWEQNETFWGRNALHFWERNALYSLASFSIFPDIRISSHSES